MTELNPLGAAVLRVLEEERDGLARDLTHYDVAGKLGTVTPGRAREQLHRLALRVPPLAEQDEATGKWRAM